MMIQLTDDTILNIITQYIGSVERLTKMDMMVVVAHDLTGADKNQFPGLTVAKSYGAVLDTLLDAGVSDIVQWWIFEGDCGKRTDIDPLEVTVGENRYVYDLRGIDAIKFIDFIFSMVKGNYEWTSQ